MFSKLFNLIFILKEFCAESWSPDMQDKLDLSHHFGSTPQIQFGLCWLIHIR